MRRKRRPSLVRWLLELPLRLLFGIGVVVIKVLIIVRRFIPPSLLLLLCAVPPLVGFSLQRFDAAGNWIMLGAVIMLAFAAGRLASKR